MNCHLRLSVVYRHKLMHLLPTPKSAVTKQVSEVSPLDYFLSAESSFYLQGHIGSFGIHLANQEGFAVNML